MASNLEVWTKSADSPSLVALAFLNGVEYHKFICGDLATLCTNFVNFGPVTPELNKGKDVHPFVDQQFGYAPPLPDRAGSVLSFLGRSLFSFISPIR